MMNYAFYQLIALIMGEKGKKKLVRPAHSKHVVEYGRW